MRLLLLALALSSQAPAVQDTQHRQHDTGRASATTGAAPTAPAPVAIGGQRDTAINRSGPASEGPKSTDWIVAVFTVVLAVLAYRQWVTSDKQREIMAAQTQLMREQYVTTFRPHIVVRGIRIERQTDSPTLRYTITNRGQSPAKIIRHVGGIGLLGYEAALPLEHWPELERQWLVEDGKRGYAAEELAPGKSTQFEVPDIPKEILGQMEEGRYRPTTPVLVGFILYEDNAGVRRHTGFARHYQPHRRRFEPMEDPDYEYAD